MAVATFELNGGAVRSVADRLHVDGVVQFDGAGIARGDARNGPHRGKFRMAIFEASDARCVLRSAATCP